MIILAFVLLGLLSNAQSTSEKSLDIYLLNRTDFKKLIAQSDKKYHLIYSFGYWCKPCLESMPKVMDIVNERDDLAFYPLIVEKLDSDEVTKNVAFLKQKYGYIGNVYSADPALGKNPRYAYHAFVEILAPEHKEYGMSLILLFHQNGNLLLATTYNQTSGEKMELLKLALSK